MNTVSPPNPQDMEKAQKAFALGQQSRRDGRLPEAIKHYRSVLRITPDHHVTLIQLGLSLDETGRSKQALAPLGQALDQEPENPFILANLGRIYLQEGKPEDALPLLQKACRLQADDTSTLHNLATAYRKIKRNDDALNTYAAVLSRTPNALLTLYDMASLLTNMDRAEAALALYDKILTIKPEHAKAHYQKGNILLDLNRSKEALNALETALKLKPDHADAKASLGEALDNLGDRNAAITAYLDALDLQKNQYKAISRLITHRYEERMDALVKAAKKGLQHKDTSQQDKVELAHALGKYAERQKDYDAAFSYFTRFRELVYEGVSYDYKAAERRVAHLIKTCTPDFFKTRQNLGSPSTRPIFIVGLPRSGTTLVEQILASHSEVAGAGELNAIMKEATIRADLARLPIENWSENLQENDAHDLINIHLEALDKESKSARFVTDKMPFNVFYLGLIAQLFPNAKVLYCQRDPLDVCTSIYGEIFRSHVRFASTLESLGTHARHSERLMEHWQSVLPDMIHKVRYEELIYHPQENIRAMLSHCRLDWEDSCMDFHKTKRDVATPSRWQVRQPLYTGSIGRWKNYEKHLDPLKKALGLPPGSSDD